MPLRTAPRHITQMLERRFPGVKLEWNPRIGYWVLTDDLYINGQKTYRANYAPPGSLVGIEPYPLSRRSAAFVLGSVRTGERWEPCRDNILNTLLSAFNGGKVWAKHDFIDRFEEREDAYRAKQADVGRSDRLDKAGEFFDREVRGKSSFSRLCAATARGVSRDLDARRAKEAQEHEEADAVADSMIRSGQFTHGGRVGVA